MKNTVGKSATVLTLAKIATMVITMVTSMLLSRFRTLEEYGTFSQMNLVVTLIVTALMLGLPHSINYFLPQAETSSDKKLFLSTYYTLNTLLCILIGVVMYFAVPVMISYFDNPLLRAFTYFAVILPWTKVTISSISNVLVVYGKTKKLALVNIVNGAVALFVILIVKFFNWSFREYMLLYLIGECVISVWVYGIVWRLEGGLTLHFDTDLIKRIFKFAIPIGIAGMVGTINIEIDKLMIGRLLNTEQLAIYTNASKELPLTIIASSLTAVLLPQMVKHIKAGKNEDAVRLWGYCIEISYLILAFIVATLIAYAPQIMSILYSDKYLPGLNVFRVYSLVLLLRFTYFGIALNAMGQTKKILWCSLITLGLNAALNYPMYLLMGFTGPAVATFISCFATQTIQLVMTSKTMKIPFSRIFPWKKLLFITLINAAWAAVVFATLTLLKVGTSLTEKIICIASGAPILIGYLLVFRKTFVMLWHKLNEE